MFPLLREIMFSGRYMFPLVGNVFSLLKKANFQSQKIVSTSKKNMFSLWGKTVFTDKYICFKRESHVSTTSCTRKVMCLYQWDICLNYKKKQPLLVGNMFALLGKQFLQAKFCFYTTEKNSLSGQKYHFLLVRNMFALLGKIVFTGKLMCWSYFPQYWGK